MTARAHLKEAAARPPRARLLVGGAWREGARWFDVVDPYRGRVVSSAAEASPADVADAVAAAASRKAEAAAAPGYRRRELLRRVAAIVGDREEEIAETVTRETGKAIKDTRVEAQRGRQVIELSAEEAVRIEGEHVPLEATELGAGKLAFLLRVPVGVVGAIVPFNAPFNLSCHKVGPAVAAGNAVVLKSAPEGPGASHLLAEAFVEAGAPPGLVNVIHGGAEAGKALVEDAGVDFITFTGSTSAGRAIKAAAGMRRVALELGGLGPNIVHADADLERAAPLCAQHGTRLAGQSCVSVQNLFVHERALARFLDLLLAAVARLAVGDPMDPKTDVGPVINEAAARRIESWVGEAVAGGARLLAGGSRKGTLVEPTVLADVRPEMKVVREEVFGPVICVRPYADLGEPIRWINGTGYGLNCGVFTESTRIALRAVREIACGGVIVNGSSSFRPDQIAYGGVGLSGTGREGPRYAVRDMTEQRLVVFNH
jgi:acyl-CoA reductase-like NAD-dependent aldehyde dehydrogenase